MNSNQVGPFGPFGSDHGPLMGRLMYGSNGGFGIARLIIMILFLLFIGAVAYVVIRHFDHAQTHQHAHVFPSASSNSADSAASEVLKMRFAKGEIDEDDFTRRMNLLKEHQTVS